MRKKSREIIAAVLFAAMVTGTFTGCKSSGSGSAGEAGTTLAQETVKEESTKAQAEETSDSGQTESGQAPAAADPKVTLNYAEQNSETSLMGMTARKFKEEVERLSGGSVEVQIYAGGVFGSEADVMDTMVSGGGTIDMSRIATQSLKDYTGIKVTNLLTVPYIFDSREHFWKTVETDLGDEILNECHEAGLGIRGLYFAEEGFRNFFFKNEVKDIADMKGKKIRSSADSTMVGTIEGLGAAPATVSFNELYSSLSSGVVDGAEQPIVNYPSNAVHEVAPYMILDGHTFGACMVVITDSAWEKLTPAQQEAVMEAGRLASEFNGENSQAVEDECMAKLREDGVTFVEVADLEPWREACAKIIGEVTAGMEDKVEQILELGK